MFFVRYLINKIKNGMSILENNIKAKNPIDILIFEKGLRIKNIVIDKSLDLLVLILNNGSVIRSKISNYERLADATSEQLNNWRLISNGIGIHWEEIDEDLSVKGFIQDAAINNILNKLQNNEFETVYA